MTIIHFLTFPCVSGPEWNEANTFEKRLLNVKGVSPGDARQVVSCIYGSDVNALDEKPVIEWFLTEDLDLRNALINVKSKSKISKFFQIKIGSVYEFVSK